MTVTFAKDWNYDRDTKAAVKVNGVTFGYAQARIALRQALTKVGGSGLQAWMDNHVARVINGPHRSTSNELHMTVLGMKGKVVLAGFHIKLTPQGNASAVSPAPTTKTGHALDAMDAPSIANSAAL